MKGGPHDSIKRDQCARVEQVVQAAGEFPAVTVKRFLLEVFTPAHFGVAVRERAARHPHRQMGVRPEGLAEGQFAVEVHRRDRHAQRLPLARPVREVGVIIRVGRNGRRTLKRLIVAQLYKLAFLRVHLGVGLTDQQ